MKQLLMGFSALFLMALSTSCGSTKTNDINTDLLTATNWELSTINGKQADAANYNSGLPVANFSTDNKISGNGGCNRYSGSYNLNDEGGINISQLISTKMFCPGTGESDYLKALNTVNIATINENKLILLNDVEEVLVFVPKK